MSGLIAAAVAPHTPRIGIEANAPPFQHGLIQGLREMGEAIRALRPDVLVLNSAHWISTFVWYADGMNPHRGVCVAHEAPDLIPGVPYERKGDPDFAATFTDCVRTLGLTCNTVETEHFTWDYGALVPLLYLDPEGTLPVVQVPTCLMADHAESMRVGAVVDAAARKLGKRAVFVASCALSHELVRGPDKWPSEERIALDRRFMDLTCAGEIPALIDWFPTYSRNAVAEMGGRNLAAFLGAASVMGPVVGRQYGAYAQSSGSGNASLLVTPAPV